MANGAKVTVRLGVLAKTLDLTEQMLEAGRIVIRQIAGDTRAGIDFSGNVFMPNKKTYAKKKLLALGHQKPLIANHRSFVTENNYAVEKVAVNHTRVFLKGLHPKAKMRIGQLGYIHQEGLGKNPKRAFMGISVGSRAKIMAFLRAEIIKFTKS